MLSTLALLLTLAAPAQALPNQDRDDLQGLVSRALTVNPLMKAADASIDEFETRVTEAKLWWIPQGKISGLLTGVPAKYGDAVNGGTAMGDWGPFYRLELVGGLPLFTFGKISALKELAAAGVDVARAQKTMAQNEIRYLVTQAYYTRIFATGATKLVGDGLEYLERGREYLDKLEEEDSDEYDQIDRLRLKVYDADIVALELEMSKNLELSTQGLAEATGLPVQNLPDANHPLPGPGDEALVLESLLRLASENRPEMQAIGHGIAAAEASATYEGRKWFPDLALMGTYSFAQAKNIEQQPSPFAYDPYNSWFGGGGLTLSMPLEPVARTMAVDRARAKVRQLRAQRQGLYLKTSLEVRQRLLEAQNAKRMAEVGATAAKAARGWVIAKTDMYENGLAPFKELTEALTQYYQRELQHRKALLDYRLTLAALARTCGVPIWKLTE
jgi:outer membrane protein TolC